MPIFVAAIVVGMIIAVFYLRRTVRIWDKTVVELKDAFLSPDELERHARQIAKNHKVTKNSGSSDCLISRMDRNFSLITSVYRMLNEDVKNKMPISPAAEWLLDNYYIIEEQVKEIRHNLAKEKCLKLNILNSGFLKGYPRIYAIAMELVSHLDGRLDETIIVNFVQAYQSQSILSMTELWGLPVMLKMALVENMRNICEKVGQSQIQYRKVEKMSVRDLREVDRLKENLVSINGGAFSFIEHLLKRLRKEGAETADILQRLDQTLVEFDLAAERVIQEEHQEQAARQVAMGNSVTSLRLVAAINWNEIFENLSAVEEVLRQDPDGTYSRMDFESRDYYRHQIERVAKKWKTSETHVARKVLNLAKAAPNSSKASHVGYFIMGPGRGHLLHELAGKENARMPDENCRSLVRYLVPIFLLTGILVFLTMGYAFFASPGAGYAALFLIALVVLIPASEIAVVLVNRFITSWVEPTFFPKLAYDEGIPEDAASIVVVPTLLPNEQRVAELVEQLEVHYMANREHNLFFALLGDLKDGPEQHLPDDQAILDMAEKKIRELNDRYGCGRDIFFFFSRKRIYSNTQHNWMGWERKRGALLELNEFLLNSEKKGSLSVVGDISALKGIKYVITLDADTKLPLRGAKKLIGTISHPLNRAVFDEQKGIVTNGYGLIQPRINVSVESSNRTLFSRIFAGQGGTDPYTTAVSDVYQDFFGEGIFTGKGIYDLDIFQKSLRDAVPDNTVLSHDLLEGCYVRVGLATDLELVDGYPAKYNSFMMRLHRWVRGDWQIIRWILPSIRNRKGELVPNPISALSKWKIIDNLRRSLVPPFLMAVFFLALTVLPGSIAFWLGAVVVTAGFPFVLELYDFFLRKHYKTEWEKRHGNMIFGVKGSLYQSLLTIVFLPYHAYLMGDAIFRTLYRVFVSRKNLLEWVTAADVERRLSNNLASFVVQMVPALVQSLAGLVLVLLVHPEKLFYALPFLAVWSVSPYIAYRISREEPVPEKQVSEDEKKELRLIARRTWAYYEDFAGAKDHFLPPDNFQANPPNGVAHRTSPTNIGFLFLAVLAARDLGFISTLEMYQRIDQTLTTVEKMKKWKGHLYNWYDTLTLNVLKPEYVSTVDSGNFVGYLMTLKQGLREYLSNPLIGRELLEGIQCTWDLAGCGLDREDTLVESLTKAESGDFLTWWSLLDRLKKIPQGKGPWGNKFFRMIESFYQESADLFLSVRFLSNSGSWEDKKYRRISELLRLLRGKSHSLLSLRAAYSELEIEVCKVLDGKGRAQENEFFQDLYHELLRVKQNTENTCRQFLDLIKRIGEVIEGTAFIPLYDKQKRLFSIGYNAEAEKLTNSYYDLLASEARITSFLAVARGEVPQEHWLRLGKSLTVVDGYKGLVSWAGTMFEYFMPFLIMKNFPNTLLDETYRFVIQAQQKYGKKRGVPWGTSESGFYSFDIQLNYQYKAFGVPDLGLKRGLINDMVVSPYSTFLTLPFCPAAALANIKRLRDDGLESDYGFYEAVDYTPERLLMGKRKGIVQSFMAHHQGMSLIALDNFLHDQVMQKRFHKDPLVKAAELLLQEKVPLRVIITKENKEIVEPFEILAQEQAPVVRKYGIPDLAGVSCHLLSNGKYFVMITREGTGFSKQEGIQVTRWREHALSGPPGFFVFLQNVHSGETWSASYQPMLKSPDHYEVIFSPHKAEFIRKDGDISTHMEVVVSPENNAEIRKVSLVNHGDRSAVIEVTSYLEVVLTSLAADIAHPVFSNLFVRTEYIDRYKSILASRRFRSAGQPALWAVHTLVAEGDTIGGSQFESDRSKFIGRGRNIIRPLALEPDQPLSNTAGAVLDPVMSLRQRVKIEPGRVAQVTFITALAQDKEEALELAEKYFEKSSIKRAFELAWTRSQVEEGFLNLSPDEIKTYQDLVAHIFFLNPLRRQYQDLIGKNIKGQPGLWAYGISGDLPIVLVTITASDQLDLVVSCLKAHEYWRFKGLSVDLVILYQEEKSYFQTLQDLIMETVLISHARDIINRPGGIFVQNRNPMPPEDVYLFYAAARVVLNGEAGSIKTQISSAPAEDVYPGRKIYSGARLPYPAKDDALDLSFFNGYGGFDIKNQEYVIRLKEGMNTPAPWANVIANPNFGFLITESGSGFTWAENSRENKLTPWSNDPVSDPPGEILFLRDEETGEVWSPTPLPIREQESYLIRHGIGYTCFEHKSHGINQEITVFVPLCDPVKINKMRLINQGDQSRRISVTFYIKPVLGVSEQITQPFIITYREEEGGPLLIKNPYNSDFPGRIAFVNTSEIFSGFTGDQKEFWGHDGNGRVPKALERESLSNRLGIGFIPCAAVQMQVEIPARGEKVVTCILGQGKNQKEVQKLNAKYKHVKSCEKALAEVKDYWRDTLGAVQVKTPDLSLDIMINTWLLYQVLSCRVWGRSAFYQAGGAYGFRDQLQDVLSLILTKPEITRGQILLHCAHQFGEGDVQHWWHPGVGDKGVRTRFSDDLLWLPFVTAHYIDATGDEGILEEEVPFLEESPLREEEHERYGVPGISGEKASVYQHCVRAIDRALKFGVHGIPLMGSGDWNDGMNTVGYLGKGESVWLGWFLYKILTMFTPLCTKMDEAERGQRYLAAADWIRENIEENAWDGNWYRRAYFDDGTPLGSLENSECKIDSLSQSWAAISGAGREERVKEAMHAVEKYLVKREEGLILLLTPPFDEGDLNPGYIKSYVPGVRENGGQYSHAAAWVIKAFAEMGCGDKAWELFNLINPVNHGRTPIESAVYKVEPYVMAADVYAVYPHIGRGGWTWYTGAASWMYQVGTESLLGLKKHGDILEIDPCIPKDWPEYLIEYRYRKTLFRIVVKNPQGVNRGVKRVTMDGQELTGSSIPLVTDQKTHHVEVLLG